MKKGLALLLVIAMLFSLAACNSSEGGGGSGKDGGSKKATSVNAVLKVVNKLANGDSSQIMMTAPDEVWERWEECAEDYDEQLEDLKKIIESSYESLKEEYGDDVKAEISMEDKEAFSEDEVEALAKCLEKKYLIDPEDVTEGYCLKLLSKTVTGEDAEEEERQEQTKTTTGYVCKIGKYWYPLEIHNYPDMSSAAFMFPINARITPSATGTSLEEAVVIAEEMLNGDTSRLEDAYPQEFSDYIQKEYGSTEDPAQYVEEKLQSLTEMYEDIYGKNYSVKLTILEQESLDDDALEELIYDLEQQMEIDANDIHNACSLSVKAKISGEKSSDSRTEQWTAVQIGDSWYISDFLISMI